MTRNKPKSKNRISEPEVEIIATNGTDKPVRVTMTRKEYALFVLEALFLMAEASARIEREEIGSHSGPVYAETVVVEEDKKLLKITKEISKKRSRFRDMDYSEESTKVDTRSGID